MKIGSFKNTVWNIFKIIGSLNFSILLLLIIAFTSIIGTIIEQDRNIMYYQMHYPINEISFFLFNWKFIIFLGLDHLYSNWWFLSMLLLFFSSLIICTLSRQLPGLNNARNWKFLQYTQKMNKLPSFRSFYNKSLSNMVYSLHRRNYYIFHKAGSIYAHKGLLGRISPIFVHISIILTLSGGVLGILGGFTAQEMITTGEVFHIHNIIKSGLNSKIPRHLIGHIKNFHVEYYPNGSIKQFFSSVYILDSKGRYLVDKQISVNQPLIFQGLTFYQTDWQINSIRFQIGQAKTMQKRLNKIQLENSNVWACTFPVNSSDKINILITSLQDKLLIYDSKGQLLKVFNVNERVQVCNTSFIVKEIMTSTGLQIKADPGVVTVYSGFFILMISIILSYLSYSQIWVKSIDKSIDLAGSTNRAALAFEEDFASVQKIYTYYTFPNLFH